MPVLCSPPVPGRVALFLDVDGTLVDIAPTPAEAHAHPATISLLRDVAAALQGAVALVSGRSIQQVDQMFSPLTLPTAGTHGLERRDAMGAIVVDANPMALDAARDRLHEFVRNTPGLLLEDKRLGLAVHYRRSPAAEAVVVKEILDVATSLGTRAHTQFGSMVAELKAGHGTKASAVAAFMAAAPFAGRVPVFVGDDLTDLDAFEWVEAHGGFAVSVGDRVRATYRLADAAGVHAWLRLLIAAQRRQPQ